MKARAEANRDRAVVVLDDRDRPRGWPWLRQLKGETVFEPVGELDTIDQGATLNDALDTMLTNSHDGVIITGDRDMFLGIADFGSSPATCARCRTRRTPRPSASADGGGAP